MIPALSAIPATTTTNSLLANNIVGSVAADTPQPGHFSSLLVHALQGVSAEQASANTAEASYAAGVPGATLGKALIASDRATVAWNATVAVRNEVVSAYQSIMNMQF